MGKIKSRAVAFQRVKQEQRTHSYCGRFVRAATEVAGDSDYRSSYFLMDLETFVLFELALEIQEPLDEIKDGGIVEVQGFCEKQKIYVTSLRPSNSSQTVKKELRAE